MTPESPQLRFTILQHDHPFLHWDLLMQQEGSLATWRLLQKPRCSVWIPSEKLPDHRLMYLDYEGPVSGGRGHVSQFCTGQYAVCSDAGVAHAVECDKAFRLTGCLLSSSAYCRLDENNQPEWRFE